MSIVGGLGSCAFRVLLAQFEVEAVEEMMKGRRQEHRDHRQKEHAAEQRICDGEDFRRWRSNRVHRSHAGEDHRSIERGIQPGEVVEEMVADRADSKRCQNEPAHQDPVSEKPPNEDPTRHFRRRMRHVDEYIGCCDEPLTQTTFEGILTDARRVRQRSSARVRMIGGGD